MEGTRKTVVEDLNGLLRGELSAIDTYRQVLDKNHKEYREDARFEQLNQLLRDHEQAASQLRELVRRLGGTAANESGAWGAWSNTVMGAARLLGDKPALKALKEGEESGVKDYRSALQDNTPPAEIRDVCTSILTREEEHVRLLDRLIEAA